MAGIQLTQEGAAVADQIYECFQNNQFYTECSREANENHDWFLEGKGQMRWVFMPLNDNHAQTVGRTAVKVSLEGGEHQTEKEIENWKKITGQVESDAPYHLLSDIVAPIGSWDEDGRWLTMQFEHVPFDEPREMDGYYGTKRDVEVDVREKLDEVGFELHDMHDEQVGVNRQGEPVLIDYGSDFYYRG